MSKSLSVRTRFEVFKRDRFVCQYCGKTPPDVLLEVDHIVPRAAGGSDDITNLTTACWDCNHGKADRLLEEGTAPTVSRSIVDDLRERLEQAAAYTEVVGQQAGLIEKQRVMVNEVWARAFGARVIEDAEGSYWQFDDGQFPNSRSINLFLRRLPIHEIIAAIDITASRHQTPSEWACRLFYKICWRRIKGESGPIDGGGRIPDAEPDDEERPDDEAYHLRVRIVELYNEADDLRDQIRDLKITVQRLREEAGRE